MSSNLTGSISMLGLKPNILFVVRNQAKQIFRQSTMFQLNIKDQCR